MQSDQYFHVAPDRLLQKAAVHVLGRAALAVNAVQPADTMLAVAAIVELLFAANPPKSGHFCGPRAVQSSAAISELCPVAVPLLRLLLRLQLEYYAA